MHAIKHKLKTTKRNNINTNSCLSPTIDNYKNHPSAQALLDERLEKLSGISNTYSNRWYYKLGLYHCFYPMERRHPQHIIFAQDPNWATIVRKLALRYSFYPVVSVLDGNEIVEQTWPWFGWDMDTRHPKRVYLHRRKERDAMNASRFDAWYTQHAYTMVIE